MSPHLPLPYAHSNWQERCPPYQPPSIDLFPILPSQTLWTPAKRLSFNSIMVSCLFIFCTECTCLGLSWWLSNKESTCNAGAAGEVSSIPGSGRSPGGGHGNPFQYSCLENSHGQEPNRLQFIGLQRVGHDWSDLACMHTPYIPKDFTIS